jgi:hypothetical protein
MAGFATRAPARAPPAPRHPWTPSAACLNEASGRSCGGEAARGRWWCPCWLPARHGLLSGEAVAPPERRTAVLRGHAAALSACDVSRAPGSGLLSVPVSCARPCQMAAARALAPRAPGVQVQPAPGAARGASAGPGRAGQPLRARHAGRPGRPRSAHALPAIPAGAPRTRCARPPSQPPERPPLLVGPARAGVDSLTCIGPSTSTDDTNERCVCRPNPNSLSPNPNRAQALLVGKPRVFKLPVARLREEVAAGDGADAADVFAPDAGAAAGLPAGLSMPAPAAPGAAPRSRARARGQPGAPRQRNAAGAACAPACPAALSAEQWQLGMQTRPNTDPPHQRQQRDMRMSDPRS